jgi:hypothetical protein
MKPQSELIKNRTFGHSAFWTNPSQTETKRFQAIHHKVKSKKGNLFSKPYTCDETGGQGEQLCTKCHKCKRNENLNFQSDEFSEKLKSCRIINGNFRHKFRVERLSQNCINCLKLQSLFQTGTEVTNGSSKLGTKWPNISKNKMRDKRVLFKMKNWTKSGSNRASYSKVSFKMKKKDEIVKFRKTNVKMKVMSKQVKFGKPKWKIKLESQSVQHNLHMKELTY